MIDRTLRVWAGILLASLLAVPAFAEAPKISGFIDTTYNYDLNRPATSITALRSFDQTTDSFLLNSIQVNLEGSMNGVGYYGELAFGRDASIYNEYAMVSVSEFAVQEAYLTYKCPITSIQLKAGKFATQDGIEVIESKDNFTISRGLLFGFAKAYTHVGALAGYTFPKIADIWIGVTNGWNLQTDNNSGKTFLTKVGFNLGEMVNGSVSITHGAEQANITTNMRTSFDTTWFIKPVQDLTLALQCNVGQEEKTNIADLNGDGIADGGVGHWYGIGIQPKYAFTDKVSLGARYEWFSDLNGARITGAVGTSTIAQNLTLAPELKMTDSLVMRVEYRHDWTARRTGAPAVFGYKNSTQSATNSTAVEFIYKF